MTEQTNKVAIVTGASRGIGAAVAERLARDGFTVVVNYSGNEAAAEALVRKIEAAGGRALSARADVADPAAVARLFDAAETAFGGVDVLVNNAGIMPLSSIADTDDAAFERLVDVNFKGTFNALREAARRLRDGGRIINFSSSVVGLLQPTYGVYAGTKAAEHHRQRRRAGADRDGPVPERQAAGSRRPLRQAGAAGAPGPAGGYRCRRRLPRRSRRRLDQRPDAARQWRNHLNPNTAAPSS